MFNVRAVESNQNGLHSRLDFVVQKHLEHPFKRPVSPLQKACEAELSSLIDKPEAWVLDSGCGLGESSYWVAQQHPEHKILAVDKSFKRLDKGAQFYDCEVLTENLWRSGSIYFFRADLVDVWQIAQRQAWLFEHCYMLYPNPWPKSEHLQKRWHGHAILKAILESCRTLTLRSNWKIYCQEFARALELAGWFNLSPNPVSLSSDEQLAELRIPQVQSLEIQKPITAFERKYHQAGQALYQVQAYAPQG